MIGFSGNLPFDPLVSIIIYCQENTSHHYECCQAQFGVWLLLVSVSSLAAVAAPAACYCRDECCVVVKLVAHPHWSDLVEFIGPAWLLLATLDAPQPRPKTTGYYVGTALAWAAVALILVFVGLWVLGR